MQILTAEAFLRDRVRICVENAAEDDTVAELRLDCHVLQVGREL